MKQPFLGAACAAVLALAAAPAAAHEGSPHEAVRPAHGGQLQVAGAHHYELVVAADATEAKDSPVLVYVTDEAGRGVATAGASGTATILTGKAKTTVALAPDGDNRLKGAGRYAAAPGMKVIVSVTPAGQAAGQARFTPLAGR